MPPSPFVSLPSASAMFTEVGSTSAPFFGATVSLGMVEVGLGVGAIIVLFLIGALIGGFSRLLHFTRGERFQDSTGEYGGRG